MDIELRSSRIAFVEPLHHQLRTSSLYPRPPSSPGCSSASSTSAAGRASPPPTESSRLRGRVVQPLLPTRSFREPKINEGHSPKEAPSKTVEPFFIVESLCRLTGFRQGKTLRGLKAIALYDRMPARNHAADEVKGRTHRCTLPIVVGMRCPRARRPPGPRHRRPRRCCQRPSGTGRWPG